MDEIIKNNIFKSFGYANEQDYIERGMSTTDAIRKGIVEFDDDIEKAVYADTAENRKLGRVGQEYKRGKGKKEDEPHGSKSGISGKEIKELKTQREELISEYAELRKKNMNGTLQDTERERFRKLGKEIDDINLRLTRKNATKKGSVEKRLNALKMKGHNNLTNEEKKEYAELSDKLLHKKMSNVAKQSPEYPSRQEEKEIIRMMEEDGLDPDEQSKKTWEKYWKKVTSK